MFWRLRIKELQVSWRGLSSECCLEYSDIGDSSVPYFLIIYFGLVRFSRKMESRPERGQRSWWLLWNFPCSCHTHVFPLLWLLSAASIRLTVPWGHCSFFFYFAHPPPCLSYNGCSNWGTESTKTSGRWSKQLFALFLELLLSHQCLAQCFLLRETLETPLPPKSTLSC